MVRRTLASQDPVKTTEFPDTPEPRRRIMRAIKGRKNGTTEENLASILRSEKISGWRRHVLLPGRPDFTWRGQRVAVFVDGCFWHGCPTHYRLPRVNREFWALKIETNRERDKRVTRELRRAGWRVIRFWECQVNSKVTLTRLRKALTSAQ